MSEEPIRLTKQDAIGLLGAALALHAHDLESTVHGAVAQTRDQFLACFNALLIRFVVMALVAAFVGAVVGTALYDWLILPLLGKA